MPDIAQLMVAAPSAPSSLPTVAPAIRARKIGYARVSTDRQDEALQLDALTEHGVDAIFTDHGVSGATTSRPRLDAALADLHTGDVLVVYSLSRLGRSMSHLLATVESLDERGVGFRSLTEEIDTSSASGRLTFRLFAALAAFERELLSERTRAGIAAARARGAVPGRRPVITAAQLRQARLLVAGGERVGDVAASMGVGRSTLYRALGAAGEGTV